MKIVKYYLKHKKSFHLPTLEVIKHIFMLQLQTIETEHFYACKTFSIRFSFDLKKKKTPTLITSWILSAFPNTPTIKIPKKTEVFSYTCFYYIFDKFHGTNPAFNWRDW